ncbi:hypothetical protein PPSIR1_29438 [Plesiocystis pacifica SIR-1]|uniref:Uncharacterized protein n=1 Tax=Plesiocystis pacifica SIR-1 TaxID=391625 RepID=A6G655_9BACT|nr:ankyrin repeat domain-containing protein [Plesiocystis pacifica]EDM78657.1 hypothetical protein PPSIR1_29438 [Plesiocystis pacifica SIR-1]
MGLSGGDWKAFYAAATQGDLAEVESWLQRGVDPNYQHPEFGTTALIGAAERGHQTIVAALVAGGAQVGLRSEWDGWTAAEAAARGGHDAVARWLNARA